MDTTQVSLPIDKPAEAPTAPPSTAVDPTRLIYLTALGVVLSLVLALSVPRWIWLWPIAFIVVLATSVGMYITAWKVEKFLSIPPFKSSFWNRALNSEQVRRYYIPLSLRIVSGVTTIGYFGTLLNWWNGSRDWDAFNLFGAYGLCGSIVFLFVALMWGHEGSL